MTETPHALIVLGAAVWASGPSPTLRRRTDHAAQLWHAGGAAQIIVCGGLGVHPPSEATAMRDILLTHGIPEAVITCEDTSTTTFENLNRAKPLLAHANATIVTDSYHLPRAMLVCRALGLKATGSAPQAATNSKRVRIQQTLREAIALPAYATKLLWWRLSRRI